MSAILTYSSYRWKIFPQQKNDFQKYYTVVDSNYPFTITISQLSSVIKLLIKLLGFFLLKSIRRRLALEERNVTKKDGFFWRFSYFGRISDPWHISDPIPNQRQFLKSKNVSSSSGSSTQGCGLSHSYGVIL